MRAKGFAHLVGKGFFPDLGVQPNWFPPRAAELERMEKVMDMLA